MGRARTVRPRGLRGSLSKWDLTMCLEQGQHGEGGISDASSSLGTGQPEAIVQFPGDHTLGAVRQQNRMLSPLWRPELPNAGRAGSIWRVVEHLLCFCQRPSLVATPVSAPISSGHLLPVSSALISSHQDTCHWIGAALTQVVLSRSLPSLYVQRPNFHVLRLLMGLRFGFVFIAQKE